jgi:hypothetical protein
MDCLKLITRLVSAVVLVCSIPLVSLAANVCDPTTGTNCVGVNSTATGGGAHISEYDLRNQFTGQKRTYSAATTAKTATAAGTTPFFTICGSASTTVRVQQVRFNYTVATTGIHADPRLQKTSTSTSGGTPVVLVQVPHDSNSAAGTANLVNYYTALATTGTVVGTIDIQMVWAQVTATVTAGSQPIFAYEFSANKEDEAIVLRGTAQCLQGSFGTTTTNAPTMIVSVRWTEE